MLLSYRLFCTVTLRFVLPMYVQKTKNSSQVEIFVNVEDTAEIIVAPPEELFVGENYGQQINVLFVVRLP